MSSCLKSIAVSGMIVLVDLGQIQKYDKISTCSHCRGRAFSYPCKGEMMGPVDASPETKGTCRRFTVSGKC